VVRVAACLVVAAALAPAAPARGDSARLADARRAVEAVDYEAARRLLLDALHDGDNGPAALGEIYRLSARAAVVLGQPEVAEQYYRRWLAIDPAAALPADAAPKLRQPFVAAQAYIAAHGRLIARAQRAPTGEVDVELVADPLAMARTAAPLDPAGAGRPPRVPFDTERRAHLPVGSRAAVLDDDGNHLLELDVPPAPPTPPAAPPLANAAAPADAPVTPTTAWRFERWMIWAVPTGVFGIGAAGFGIAGISTQQRATQIAKDSNQHFLSEAHDNAGRARTFTWIAAGAAALAAVFAIPTAIYYLDARDHRATVVPTAGDGRAGIAVVGRF
jgi:hypothetical protein